MKPVAIIVAIANNIANGLFLTLSQYSMLALHDTLLRFLVSKPGLTRTQYRQTPAPKKAMTHIQKIAPGPPK